MPWIANSPLIRLTCWIRSLISRPRSRWSRRSSSSATLGTRTTLQTFGSPRRYAISDRSNRSASTRSVLARRARRSTCRLAGSMTWLRMCLEQTVEPEAVVAGLVTRNHFHALRRFFGNARPDPLAKIQELLPITGLQRVATDLVRQRRVDRDNPTLLAQFDCKNTAYGIIMGSSGWQVVHCPGFHQYLLCTGGDLTPWVGSSFPPATPCIGSGKRRLCTAHTQTRHQRQHSDRWFGMDSECLVSC